MRRFPARCRWRVIPRNSALDAYDGLAIPVFCDAALRNLSEAGEFFDGAVNLFDGKFGRSRDFAIEQLSMLFQMLENEVGWHIEPFQNRFG